MNDPERAASEPGEGPRPASTRKALASTYAALIFNFLVTFASTIVVARLVSPRDFGIFAMAGAITTIINVLMQFGLAKYLLREDRLPLELLRLVFTVNVVMTLVYVAAIAIGAVVANVAFHSPEVGEFLSVFAIFPLFAMMEFIPATLCARDLRFGLISAISVVRAVLLAGATITLAFLDFAYMSFAWAQVIAWVGAAVMFNIACWRPEVWRLRFRGFVDVMRFGTQMVGISGIAQLANRAGEMIIGSLLGLGGLGLYSRASGLPASLTTNVLTAGSNVIFTRLSRGLREQGEFHKPYLHFMRILLALLWPALFGVATLSQPLIHILYGAKWQAAAAPLSALSAAAAITVGLGMASEVFILRHATGRQVRMEIARAIVGLILITLGAMVSLLWAAIAKVGEAIVATLLYRRPMTAMVGGPRHGLRNLYVETALLTLAAILPALVLMMVMRWSPDVPLEWLTASVVIGVGLWAGALRLLRHPLADEVLRVLRKTT